MSPLVTDGRHVFLRDMSALERLVFIREAFLDVKEMRGEMRRAREKNTHTTGQ